jgi:hypothetical protein
MYLAGATGTFPLISRGLSESPCITLLRASNTPPTKQAAAYAETAEKMRNTRQERVSTLRRANQWCWDCSRREAFRMTMKNRGDTQSAEKANA